MRRGDYKSGAGKLHELARRRRKRPLLSRRHNVIDGKWIQRDLYSAFLIMNSDAEMAHADRALCKDTYDNFLILHDRCIEELKSGGHELLSSFGISRAL